MASLSVTESEMLDVIREAMRGAEEGDDALTYKQIMEAVGVCKESTYNLIHRMVKAGTLEPVKVKRRTIAGHLQTVSAYVLARPAAGLKIA